MYRPKSIVMFERLYLGCVAVGVLDALAGLQQLPTIMAAQAAQMEAQGQTVPNLTGFMYRSMIIGLILTLGMSALIWFFIARKGAAWAKWVEVVLVAIVGVSLLFNLVVAAGAFPTPVRPSGLVTALRVIAFALQAGAVYFLFKPDALRWFDGERDDLQDTFK